MSVEQLKADVAHLHECLESVKKEVAENTAITKEIRDILATFRILGAIAKWVAGCAAAVAAIYHGVQFWRGQ